jgi:hypothetical protein
MVAYVKKDCSFSARVIRRSLMHRVVIYDAVDEYLRAFCASSLTVQDAAVAKTPETTTAKP